MKSIFELAPDMAGRTAKDMIGILGTELTTCERLLVMGFTKCNGVDLKERVEELNKSISHLEEVVRKQQAKSKK